MSDLTPALIWCPFPDREAAREAAKTLLEEKLIACANIIGDIEAIFVWDGRQSSDIEVAVMFKTTDVLKKDAVSLLGDIHPYDTPAILAWNCDAAHPETLAWLGQQLGSS